MRRSYDNDSASHGEFDSDGSIDSTEDDNNNITLSTAV